MDSIAFENASLKKDILSKEPDIPIEDALKILKLTPTDKTLIVYFIQNLLQKKCNILIVVISYS